MDKARRHDKTFAHDSFVQIHSTILTFNNNDDNNNNFPFPTPILGHFRTIQQQQQQQLNGFAIYLSRQRSQQQQESSVVVVVVRNH